LSGAFWGVVCDHIHEKRALKKQALVVYEPVLPDDYGIEIQAEINSELSHSQKI